MQKLVTRVSVLFASFIVAVLVFPAAAFGVTFPAAVDSTNFPDATWRAYVNTNFAGGDNVLTQAEAEAVTNINVFSLGITDLTGIEYFTNTTILSCVANSLTSLDVTSLTNLQTLDCSSNSLTTLDVTGLINLQTLTCSSNSLTLLDLTGLTSLQTLNCPFNSLTALDATALTSLQTLSCYNNSLTSLDVTGLTNLLTLTCNNNSLTSLDVTGLTNLSVLTCFNNSLTSLNAISLTNLTRLFCFNNSLTTLDVTGLSSLLFLECYNNSLLEVLGLPSVSLDGTGQTRTIPMVSDGAGGYVSSVSYPLQAVNLLGGLDAGVTYDSTTGLFHADIVPRTSSFSTDLSGSGFSVSGTLTFSLVLSVTYDANGGSGTMIDPDSPYEVGDTVTVLGNAFTAPTGMTFAGWNTAPDGSGIVFAEGETFSITEDTILYAQWEVITYTVTFLDWDGTVLGSDTVNYGDSAVAPADPTREGYTFIGWDISFDNVTSDLIVTALYEQNVAPTPLPVPTEPSETGLAKTEDASMPVAVALLGMILAGAGFVAARKRMLTR